MDEARKKRIIELKERIFLLQVEERRLCALLARPMRSEELKAKNTKDLTQARYLLEVFTTELKSLDDWSR